VAVDGHPSALREVRLAGLRPAQEPAPTETAGNGSQPPTTDVGVHLIHHIPGGTACVDDQVERIMKQDQSFKDLLYTQYKDADVVETLAQANDLASDGEGQPTVYVPPGDRVVIPAMCYAKSGADAVSLDASGDQNPPSAIGGILVFAFILIVLYVILIGAGRIRRLWKT
jgi:hypothetical protein